MTYFPAIAVLGLGMTISVAPLTTVVMNSVEADRSGMASGTNNAVSQIAALLALALSAPLFFAQFSTALKNNLRQSHVSSETAAHVERLERQLGAIQTTDPQARQAIDDSFVAAFRLITLIAAGCGRSRRLHRDTHHPQSAHRPRTRTIEQAISPLNDDHRSQQKPGAGWPIHADSLIVGMSGVNRHPPYFSAVGGTIFFSRRYVDSSAYCSLSCDTFPHAIPIRERLPCPSATSSAIFASVSAPYALSHTSNDAFSPATIVALSAVSLGTVFGSNTNPFIAEHDPLLRLRNVIHNPRIRANVRRRLELIIRIRHLLRRLDHIRLQPVIRSLHLRRRPHRPRPPEPAPHKLPLANHTAAAANKTRFIMPPGTSPKHYGNHAQQSKTSVGSEE